MRKSLVLAAAAMLATAPVFARSLELEIVDARPNMVAFQINDNMSVCGDNQINSQVTAVVWDVASGATILPGANGISQAGDINRFGDVAGWFESASSGLSTAVVWYAGNGYQRYTELGFPSNIYLYTQAYAINDGGDVVVNAGLTARTSPGYEPFELSSDPYRWTPQRGYTALQNLSGKRGSMALDINNSGVIVGSSYDLGGNETAVQWGKNDRVKSIGIPAFATTSRARSINDMGSVVGSDARDRDSWVWNAKTGFVRLPDFGFNASALDINNSGIIAGTADKYPYDPVPVVWDADGNLYDLQEIAGFDRYYFFEGVTINDNNEMVIYGYNMMTGDRDAVVVRLHFID